MSIETWLGISIFLNFCFGIEDLYRRREQLKTLWLKYIKKNN